tara:strand:- start:264 stop:437 length:174 start_codon:yes stop_codon:yes gene_type:complete
MARKPNYAAERNARAKAKTAKREAKRQAKLAAKDKPDAAAPTEVTVDAGAAIPSSTE